MFESYETAISGLWNWQVHMVNLMYIRKYYSKATVNSPLKLRILPKLLKHFICSLLCPHLKGNYYLKNIFSLLFFLNLILKILAHVIIPIQVDLPEKVVPLNNILYILLFIFVKHIVRLYIDFCGWLFSLVFLCCIHDNVYSAYSLIFSAVF